MRTWNPISFGWKWLQKNLNLLGGMVQERTPIAGNRIIINETPNGFIISVKDPPKTPPTDVPL